MFLVGYKVLCDARRASASIAGNGWEKNVGRDVYFCEHALKW
jgi:hypothetical protein